MYISGINSSSNPNFEAIKVRKIKPVETKQLGELTEMYNEVSTKFNKYNFPYRMKFKRLFPGLLDDNLIRGFVLHSNDDWQVNLHIRRFGQDEPVKLDLLDESKKSMLACTFENDEITIKTSDEYDQDSKNDMEASVKLLFENAMKEMSFLYLYSRTFEKIRKFLNGKNTKAEIAKIIDNIQSKPSEYGKSEDVQKMLQSYANINQRLSFQPGVFVSKLKEEYFDKKHSYRNKGLSFILPNGEKLVFLSSSAKDGKSFRIFKYSQDGELNFGVYANEDGTFDKLKDVKKPVVKHNLIKMSENQVLEYKIPEMVKFLSEELAKFDKFTEEYISNNKLVQANDKKFKVISKEEYQEKIRLKAEKAQKRAEQKAIKLQEQQQKALARQLKAQEKEALLEEKRLEREKLQQERENKLRQERIAKARRERLREQKQIRLDADRAEKLKKMEEKRKRVQAYMEERKKKRIAQTQSNEAKTQTNKQKKRSSKVVQKAEKKPVAKNITLETGLWAVEKNKNIYAQPTQPQKIQELTISEIISKIDEVFATPVEKRHPRYSHLKMKDGSVFSGKFFIEASDGAKISVTRIKSQKYVDFKYVSIMAEKDGVKSYINLDPDYNRFMLTDDSGKPVIIDGIVKHISRSDFLENNPFGEKWNDYLYELFFSETEKGSVVDSNLQKAKVKSKKIVLEEIFEEEINNPLNDKRLY